MCSYCHVSICANVVAYCSFREDVKWTADQCISLVIIIGLMARAPLEITVARLCPGSKTVLAPPLPVSYVEYVTLLCSRHHETKLEFVQEAQLLLGDRATRKHTKDS